MAGQSLVAQWNEMLLDAIRSGSAKPTVTTWHLHLTSAAVYDAWAAYDAAAYGHYSEIERPAAEHTEANKAEAISYAAYRMLSAFFPAQQAKFDVFMAELGYDTDVATTDLASAAGVGNLAAAGVFAARAGDGSNAANGFFDTTGYVPVNGPDETAPNGPGGPEFDPNRWQPLRVPNGTLTDANGVPTYDNDDPSTYVDQVALTPHWGSVAPFALASGDQFRPPPPPRLGDFTPYTDALGNLTTYDQAYRDQVAEVLEVSAGLTTEQKVVAEFWADGPRTESPPGHWNQIAQDIALREGHGIDEDARLFFAVNAALFDAGIATWETKYAYDSIRPQSAIRHLYHGMEVQAWGGPDEGTATILGREWQPYQSATFVTPPFPEYVSGHSTFSMAAARTIAAFVGSDAYYDGVTLANYDLDNLPGTDRLGEYVANRLSFERFPDEEPVVLRWATLTEAAEEAGISRIYGGIHIQDGNLRGQEIGAGVAAQAEVRWQALFTRGGDDRIVCEETGGLVIAGAGHNDVLGAAGVDSVEGDSGDDTMHGAGGNDALTGEAGDDRIHGDAGDDLLLGGDGADTVYGGDGSDAVAGENGADKLTGGQGNDLVLGGAGADTISGDTGDDVLLGGDDADSLVGGAGDDAIGGESGDDSLSGDAGRDLLLGGAGADWVAGGWGDDTLLGEDGADQLIGGEGDDALLGGGGADVLAGGAGADILVGGDGADALSGDAGADWFVFAAGHSARDTILDFDGTPGGTGDGIALSGFGPGAAVTLKETGLALVIAVDGIEVAMLIGIGADAVIEGVNLFLHDVAFA